MNNPTLEAIESLEEQNKKLLKIQHALEKKVSQLKDFAGIITHDVRGPAHNISKMLDMYESTNDPELKKASMDYLKKISNLAVGNNKCNGYFPTGLPSESNVFSIGNCS